MKTCSFCKKDLPLDSFTSRKYSKDKLMGECKLCRKTKGSQWYFKNKERCARLNREYRLKNRDRVLAIERRYVERNREMVLKRCRDYYQNLRTEIFNAYGNKCACCGETKREFFALDHIQGGGTKEKSKLGTRPLYRKIISEGCPKDKYQILCHNCNMSLGFYGYCPHHPEIKRPVIFGGQKKTETA